MTTDSIPSLRAMPAVPSTGELDTSFDDFDERRSMNEQLAEIDAVSAGIRVVDRREDAEEARRLVASVLEARRGLTPHVVEDYAIVCAMAKIVGEDVTPFVVPAPHVTEETWTRFATRAVLNAWTLWAAGKPEKALDSVADFYVRQQDVGGPGHERTRAGGVNLMTLYYWSKAIESLARGDRSEALRIWRRALEVAVRHGTNSSVLIQWTYVASFFPS